MRTCSRLADDLGREEVGWEAEDDFRGVSIDGRFGRGEELHE